MCTALSASVMACFPAKDLQSEINCGEGETKEGRGNAMGGIWWAMRAQALFDSGVSIDPGVQLKALEKR